MLILWMLFGSAMLFVLQRVIYSRYWDEKVRIDFSFAERAVTEGDAAEIEERSENRKLLPLPTYGYRYVVKRNFAASSQAVEDAMTLVRKLALPGRRAVVNRARISGLTRGVYAIGEVMIYGSDLFYTLHMERPTESTARLTVYPAKIPARKLSIPVRLLLGSVATRRMAQEDPFALKAIRPYEIYDSPRIINWKASAKTGELKVNQFDHTTDQALLFLLDMEGGEETAREELIRLASSLSLLFLRRGVSVAMLSNGRNCATGKPIRVLGGADLGHQNSIDESLAHINLATPVTEHFPAFLAGLPQAFLRGALPVGISADPSGEAMRAFQALPGTRGGYFLSVTSENSVRTEGGITLINWNGSEGDERL